VLPLGTVGDGVASQAVMTYAATIAETFYS